MKLFNSGSRLFWTLVVFLAINIAIFSSGFYAKFLTFSSMQGFAHHIVSSSKDVPINKDESIFIIGDSRITEGFNAGDANLLMKNSKIHYLNAGMGGASLRIWYYLLKEIDPDANRFNYIVVTLPSFRNSPPFDAGYEGRMLDADFLAPLISSNDFLNFIDHQTGYLNKFILLNRMIIASINYSNDFFDLILHPLNRIDGYKWRKKVSLNYGDEYKGNTENMAGLSIDKFGNILSYPLRLNNIQKEQITKYLSSIKNTQSNEIVKAVDYKNYWLRKILDRYKNTSTKVVIMRLPSTPLPVYLSDYSYPLLSVIEENRNAKNPIIVPEDSFLDLEALDNFWDMQHLNAVGRSRLTTAITQKISRLGADK